MTDSTFPVWVKTELLKADEASARGKIEMASKLQATAARFDARKKVIIIELANGASFAFPPSLVQGLAHARARDLGEIEITPVGIGLHWPRLNKDLTVAGLLASIFLCH